MSPTPPLLYVLYILSLPFLISTFTPSYTLPSTPPTVGILVIDGFSPFHSAYLRDLAVNDYSAGVVNALSPYTARGLRQTADAGEAEDYESHVPPLGDPSKLKAWLDAIPFELVGVFCESDAGLDFSERLSLEVSSAYASFVPPVIVKPPIGCASEGVFLCHERSEAVEASRHLLSQTEWGKFGTPNPSVVLQEYLPGPEFAVDCVSVNGVHKVVAVWSYVKTDAGFGPFAYLSTSLSCPEDDPPVFWDVCRCALSGLDGLSFMNGLSHAEVKLRGDGEPRLVEVNCRQHNANVLPLTKSCVGYDAVEVLAEGYLSGEEGGGGFKEVPPIPGPLRRRGTILHLQCPSSGTVLSLSGLGEISRLPTVVDMDFYEDVFGVGCSVQVTRDIRGDAGWVVFTGGREEVERDYERARE
ncbi:hypothetical protein TrRE_jg10340, partial [Triparma retinervis]